MNKKYFIKTFGCQMNASDSERIASFLEQRGFLAAEKIQDADLAVFNTCGIKQTAENRVYSLIHNLKKQDTKNKIQTKIVMTGCLANRSDVQKRMKKSVDLFCEIKDFEKKLKEIILCHPERSPEPNGEGQSEGSRASNDNRNLSGFFAEAQNDRDYLSITPKHTNNFQAYVPIMTGCNNFCAYCVVPHARGREVSRPAEEILTEVRSLVKQGYAHITLLGQNVNSYRGTFGRGTFDVNFSKLLRKINSIPGKFWISFVSSHPKDFSDELIGTVAKCKKVCECIHLPIQAGNDAVLKKMNRRYSQAHYFKLIKKIKTAFKKYKPDTIFSLSSDIIVGFPGETRKQFLDSAEIMEKAGFDMVFFGQFSPRPGTAAWEMKDDVSQKEKARREKFLNEILKKTTSANNKKYVGKKMEVLVESEKNGLYFGKTRTMKNVKIISDKKIGVGTFIKVKITQANVWNLEGTMK